MPESLGFIAHSGIVIVLFTSGLAALRYRGRKGERYSPLNHFVSELGEVGISVMARWFNLGLILGGLLLLPFILGLGGALRTWLGWLGTAAGVVAALALAAIGAYPMNNLENHARAAMMYFRAGLAMVFFFGLAILFQPEGRVVVPRLANVLSLMAFASYSSFLLLLRPRPEDSSFEALDPEGETERLRIWLLPVVEWVLFCATVLWVLGMALVAG
jgi:hypothetical membrane protein